MRANIARDGQKWHLAAALYEEALRIAPSARLHKQSGHMLKEAGLFDAADRHYREAGRLDPDDADLALQIGHFEMVRSDPVAAADAYRRALVLQPGWNEPLEALGRLGSSDGASIVERAAPGYIAELLPSEASPVLAYRKTVQIRRLGSIRREGGGRILRGVEAIRGFCISAVPVTEMTVTLGEADMGQHPLSGIPLPGGNHKHVFNLWFDFSEMPRGDTIIELRFRDVGGHVRSHRVAVEVGEPLREIAFPNNDTIIDPADVPGEALVASINARPSVIHPSMRAPLERPASAIFVQRIDQLGDLIVSVPALERLRRHFPEARISLAVSPANVDFAKTLDVVDELLPVDVVVQPDGRRTISGEAQSALLAQLQGRQFDLAIDLNQGPETRPLLRLPDARFTYGFRTATAPWLSGSFDLAVPDAINGLETCSPSRKLVAMIDALARLYGDQPPPALPRRAHPILRDYDLNAGRYFLLHTGARLEMNRWPHFDELARMILAETDYDVLLFADGECPNLELDGRLRRIGGPIPFTHFDAIVSGCAVFVGNDSGPKHLAATRGVPAISLHLARLNWMEWGQEGRGSIISRRVPCAGCGIDRDPEECGQNFACLRYIQPAEVLAEIVRLAGV